MRTKRINSVLRAFMFFVLLAVTSDVMAQGYVIVDYKDNTNKENLILPKEQVKKIEFIFKNRIECDIDTVFMPASYVKNYYIIGIQTYAPLTATADCEWADITLQRDSSLSEYYKCEFYAFSVTLTANKSGNNRIANITFESEGAESVTFPLIQRKQVSSFYEASFYNDGKWDGEAVKELNDVIPWTDSIKYYSLYPNFGFTIESYPEWIDSVYLYCYDETDGGDETDRFERIDPSAKVILQFKKNNTDTPREGTVVLRDMNGEQLKINITHTAKDYGILQPRIENLQNNLYCGGNYWTSHDDFGLPANRLMMDLWGEDIAYYRDQQWFCYDYQLDNRLGNYRRTNSLWKQLYDVIDGCNSLVGCIKPTDGNDTLPQEESKGRAILGEVYAMRAYAYYWLINLWQHPYAKNPDAPGIPVRTEESNRIERVPVREVYALILSDIEKAYKNLEGLGFHNGKVGLSEYAAAAIWANVLMFTGDYENAAKYAEIAIKGGQLNSAEEMLGGFNSLDMPEVIWGYDVTVDNTGYYASFFSHVDSYFMGYGGQVGYRKLVASDLYNKIADNDVRKGWFGYNENYNLLGNVYEPEVTAGFDKYIQNKFRDAYMTTNGSAEPFTSDIIYTRIAEMYFVAAEAYYLSGNWEKARETLNEIMVTRVADYNCTLTGEELYNEICLQKRIEMWMEGCRMFDAKRRGETIDRTTSENHSTTTLEQFNTMQYKADEDYRMIFRIPQNIMNTYPNIVDNE